MFLSNFINNFNNPNYNINSFLDDLKTHLNKPSSITYIIDRFENGYAVCENIKTLKMENILISKLPKNIKEGCIIKFENGKYFSDNNLQVKRNKEIQEKLFKAWKN